MKKIFYLLLLIVLGMGVPGAFMSLVGHSLLNTAVKENDILEPAAILNFLNKGVTKTLRQTTSNLL